jgi:hypothetical protein
MRGVTQAVLKASSRKQRLEENMIEFSKEIGRRRYLDAHHVFRQQQILRLQVTVADVQRVTVLQPHGNLSL